MKTSWSQVQEEQYELDLSASVTSSTADGPSFLCGIVSPIGTAELLASLPAKPVADKLLAIFFDEEDSLVPSIRKNFSPSQIESCTTAELTIDLRYLAQAYILEAGMSGY